MVDFRFTKKPNKAHLINWNPWGKEAFSKAARENKPIFLSLAASWCHWCHVMDETSLSHIPSISYLNENFVAIRVDTDKRPDIQNRYIKEGWPTNAFLTDEGDIIAQSTYVSPQDFYRLINHVNDDWLLNKEKIKKGAALERQELRNELREERASKLNIKTIDNILDKYRQVFDAKFGGFGLAMKFPASLAMELLLRESQIRQDNQLLNMVLLTLDKMAAGEIFDKEQGGFYRYSTERDWSQPHYEKMLSENAGIIMNYLQAYEVTNKKAYREVALKCLDFIDRKFANHPAGAFYGSQDADSGEIDEVIYTDSNCKMISTYLEAFRILGSTKYLTFARDSLRFLLSNNLSSFGAAHYYAKEEDAQAFGMLSDQTAILQTLVDLYEYDREIDYLTQANDIVDILINRFADNGSLFDKAEEPDDIGYLKIRYKPVRENALLALGLQRFSVLSSSKDFADMAKNILSSFSFKNFKDDFISMAPYGLALSEILGEEIRKAA